MFEACIQGEDLVKVAVIQMVSTPDVANNMHTAQIQVAAAVAQGAELVVLPEYFCALGWKDTDKLTWSEPAGHGPLQATLARWAQMHGIWLAAGTLPLHTATPGRLYNSLLLFNPQGAVAARYDKIHLFRFSTAAEHYDESLLIEAGTTPVMADITDRQGRIWKVGFSVCYDLRFAELYRHYAQQGAHLLLVPSAFTHTTGQAHWDVLLRARAIENQCWVLAAAQGGQHPNGRHTWGHSMVVDPWGHVIAEQIEDGAGVSCAVLDIEHLQQVRQRLPALEHRFL